MTGKGISTKPGDVVKGKPVEFVIDLTAVLSAAQTVAQTRNTTVAGLLQVTLHDAFGNPVDAKVVETSSGKFTCTYTAKMVGVVTVFMSIAGANLRESGVKVGCSI